jgi:oligoribonuclease (3'-5' exoribonuclease)
MVTQRASFAAIFAVDNRDRFMISEMPYCGGMLFFRVVDLCVVVFALALYIR